MTSDPLDDLARGYIPLDTQTREAAWKDGTVVLDTNVLLNLYRYSPTTRAQLLDVLTKLRERVWVPHQCAQEYFRRRATVLTEQLTARDQLRAKVESATSELTAGLAKIHQALGRRDTQDDWTDDAAKLLDQLKETVLKKEAGRLPAQGIGDDEIHEALLAVIRGRVGQPFDDERLGEIETDGEQRFKNQIPPGYLDADKADNRFGDLILWKQVLEHAQSTRVPVILVSDDQKDDWVWSEKGRKLGPRPELVRELHAVAEVPLLMYTTSRFLEAAGEALASEVAESVIAEAEKVARSSSEIVETKRTSTEKLVEMGAAWVHDRLTLDEEFGRQYVVGSSGETPEIRIGFAVGRHPSRPSSSATFALNALDDVTARITVRIVSPDGLAFSRTVDLEPATATYLEFPGDFGDPTVHPGTYAVSVTARARGRRTILRRAEFTVPAD